MTSNDLHVIGPNKSLLAGLILVLLLTVNASVLKAYPDSAFRSLVDDDKTASVKRVSDWADSHTDHVDFSSACQWVLQTATATQEEASVLDFAGRVVAGESASSACRDLARRVRFVGLARKNEFQRAFEEFQQLVDSTDSRRAAELLPIVQTVCTLAQASGEVDQVRELHACLQTQFFLNRVVRRSSMEFLSRFSLVGQPAPALSAERLTPGSVDLADLRGRVVLVDFWATNCVPCLEELPRLRRLYADLKEEGFEIVGVSLDDDRAMVAEFLKHDRLSWPIVMDLDQPGSPRDSFHVDSIPSSFVIDCAGRIAIVDPDFGELRAIVLNLTKRAPSEPSQQGEPNGVPRADASR